ncbi:hypothetical protein TRFO_28975 [Tritrichomonas foetus]|uniref:VWFD domain-containing protein n=1 Tax=Tritrichomonas foetus TaxID=1144522 RepID=A0A1J4K1I9_9EUKA|nr:hypothetical protein TRFO_28975 [Tritrichomonas foetus]|eukprot:OHT03604.1 hypothetical protein TRFO_28975 [Tritrichomonas foetus]
MLYLLLSAALSASYSDQLAELEKYDRSNLCFCIAENSNTHKCSDLKFTQSPNNCDVVFSPSLHKTFRDYVNVSTVQLLVPDDFNFTGEVSLNKYAHGSLITLLRGERYRVRFDNKYRVRLNVIIIQDSSAVQLADNLIPVGEGVANFSAENNNDFWASGDGDLRYCGPILDLGPSFFDYDYTIFSGIITDTHSLQFNIDKAPGVIYLTEGAQQITLYEPGYTCTVSNSSIEISLNQTGPKIKINEKHLQKARKIILDESKFDSNVHSPTFTINNDKCNLPPVLSEEKALLTIEPHGNRHWVFHVQSDEWAQYRFVEFSIGSPDISNTGTTSHFTGTVSLIMETEKPIVSIDSYISDMHVYLNHTNVVLSEIVKEYYAVPGRSPTQNMKLHIVNLLSEEENFYVAYSKDIDYYVDRRETKVNVYIGESNNDHFLTSNGHYIIQNIVTFASTYRETEYQTSYKYGVFENKGMNDFFSNVNNLELANEVFIDLEGNTELPIFLNGNISFPGNLYLIGIDGNEESFYFKDDIQYSEYKDVYVLCQPNLDCSKFSIAPKSHDIIKNPSTYWQQEGLLTTICEKYSTFWPRKEKIVDDNKCCKELLDSNEATESMTCVGYRISMSKFMDYRYKYETVYPDSDDESEEYFQTWCSQIYRGTKSIKYQGNHPLEILPVDEIKNCDIVFQNRAVPQDPGVTDSIIIDQKYENTFSSFTAYDIFFRFRNPSRKVIPFKSLHIDGDILNPNLADIDFSQVHTLSLRSSFYKDNLESFRNISNITVVWDTYEEDIGNAIEIIREEYHSDYLETMYIDFTDLGVNVNTNETQFKALTLFNTQRNRHVFLTVNHNTISSIPISFSNLAIDYHVKFSNLQTNPHPTILIKDINSQNIELINNFAVRFITPNINQFKFNLTDVTNLEFQYRGSPPQQDLKKDFSFGCVDTSNDLSIKFNSPSYQFSEINFDYLKMKAGKDIDITTQYSETPRIKVGILDVSSTVKSQHYIPFNFDVTGTIVIQPSITSIEIPDQQYVPNLNITLSKPDDEFSVIFSGDRISVNKITLKVESSKERSCQGNRDIYHRIYEEKFENNSFYKPYENYHFLTCVESPLVGWKSFTPMTEFEYCEHQYASVHLHELTLTPEEVDMFASDKYSGNIGANNYTCLAYKLNYTRLDHSLTSIYYIDTVKEDGPSFEIVGE